MTEIATILEKKGWTLRSGAADGPDLAFENGVQKRKEIFLPWRGYNNSTSTNYIISDKAYDLVSSFEDNWKYLKEGHKKILAYNVHQVLGTIFNLANKDSLERVKSLLVA